MELQRPLCKSAADLQSSLDLRASSVGDLQHWFWGFNNHKVFQLIYSSLLQSQDFLYHNMAWIIEVTLYRYVLRYGDGLSDREYISGRLWGRYTSSHYATATLHPVQRMVLPTLAELSLIHTMSVVPQTLLPRIQRSMQFVWYFMARYPFIFSHPLLTFLKPELLSQEFPSDSIRGVAECWWSVVRLLAPPIPHMVIEWT